MTAPYVLVHGSCMCGKAWAEVAARLRTEHGLEVHTPTQAGHGPEVPTRQVTHAQVVQSIVDYVEAHDVTDFVLVGHSFGGTVIQKVAEAIPERIRRLVFWNAFVLLDGECLHDNVPEHMRAMLRGEAAATEDGAIVLPFPIYRDVFINDADLALAQATYEALYPEYVALFDERLDLKAFYALDIPKSYLYSWDDAALPHGEETGWYPRFGNRLGLIRFVSMPGGHMALLTAPELLADKIVEAGRD